MSMYLLERLAERRDPATIAICAFWATFLFTGLFNTTNPVYGLIVAPLLVATVARPETNWSAAMAHSRSFSKIVLADAKPV
jgi:hypothetical protein